MTVKTEVTSRRAAAMHVGAADLHRLDFIDKRTMHKHDLRCLEPVSSDDAAKIRALRDRPCLTKPCSPRC